MQLIEQVTEDHMVAAFSQAEDRFCRSYRARPEVGGHATSSARGAFEPEAVGRDGIAWIDHPFTGRSTLKPTTG